MNSANSSVCGFLFSLNDLCLITVRGRMLFALTYIPTL